MRGRNRAGTLRLTPNQAIRRNVGFIEALAGREIPELRAGMKPAPQPRIRRTSEPSGKPLERDVLRAILEALRAHPAVCFAWRLQSGVFLEGNRTIRVGFKGMPDICFMTKRGIFGAIEVKRPGGQATPEQAAVLERIWTGGGIAGTCSSVEQALALIP